MNSGELMRLDEVVILPLYTLILAHRRPTSSSDVRLSVLWSLLVKHVIPEPPASKMVYDCLSVRVPGYFLVVYSSNPYIHGVF